MDLRYYNHAMIPATALHEVPDLSPLKDGSIWKKLGRGWLLFLLKWIFDFDCAYETNWWYCIKDEPFDISKLNSKKRYEINKGKKIFDVRVINPIDYVDAIVSVQEEAWKNYPKEYRPGTNIGNMKRSVLNWTKFRVFGAFGIEDGELHAFSYLEEHDLWTNLAVLKPDPNYERLAVNAALVAGICEYYNPRLSKKIYIGDGERNMVHVKGFQSYLIKYFNFRNAYCRLNVHYRQGLNVIVKIIYPFRKLLMKLDDNSLVHKINALLKMEEIVRN